MNLKDLLTGAADGQQDDNDSDSQQWQSGRSPLVLIDVMLMSLPPEARKEITRRTFSDVMRNIAVVRTVANTGAVDTSPEPLDPEFFDSATNQCLPLINELPNPGPSLKLLNTINDALKTFVAESLDADAPEYSTEGMLEMLAGHAGLMVGAIHLGVVTKDSKTRGHTAHLRRGELLKAERDEMLRNQASGDDAPAQTH